MKPQCCKNCKFSRWWLTAKGRIHRHTAGKCVVPIVIPALPSVIKQPEYYRSPAWEEWGTKCPLYEENPGKPIAEVTP